MGLSRNNVLLVGKYILRNAERRGNHGQIPVLRKECQPAAGH